MEQTANNARSDLPRPSDSPRSAPDAAGGRGIKGEGISPGCSSVVGPVPNPDTPLLQHSNTPSLQSGESDEAAFTRLARLSPGEYDRARQSEAARLGIRKETLDSEVAKRRPLSDAAQGRAVHLPAVEPWPEPVDGAQLLDEVSARNSAGLVLPPGAADAMALWSEQAHACPAFVHTPRLNLSSSEPGCGKTTTLDLIATMTPRPLRTENLTAPVLFRLVDQHQPTLLLDEVDSYLTSAEELRGLLNAGHKRGACAYRCEGEGNAVRAFKAFAPAVLSGIGELPGTLRDRSIIITLLPAEADQLESPFDGLHTEIETVLCRKLARWTEDNFVILQACEPTLPPTAFNRLGDNWRPLFAIAQVAGGDWPRRALEAFNQLTNQRTKAAPRRSLSAFPRPSDGRGIKGEGSGSGEGQGEVDSSSPQSQIENQKSQIALLTDIQQIFTQSGSDRMSSKQLVDALRSLDEARSLSAFPRPSGGRGVRGEGSGSGEGRGEVARYFALGASRSAYNWLGQQLQRFGLKSRAMRIGGETVKGYALADLTQAISIWLES
jgi:hypothetical protein